jgi:hypothetical protein
MNINYTFQFKKVRKMQNLGNVYIWGSPFVMSRTDAQNGMDIISLSFFNAIVQNLFNWQFYCGYNWNKYNDWTAEYYDMHILMLSVLAYMLRFHCNLSRRRTRHLNAQWKLWIGLLRNLTKWSAVCVGWSGWTYAVSLKMTSSSGDLAENYKNKDI